MKRKTSSLRRQTGMCQKLQEAFGKKLITFQKYVLLLQCSNAYILGQVGNAYQTLMYFNMPANTTVELKDAKQVRVLTSGNEKTHAMAMLASAQQMVQSCLLFTHLNLPKNVNFRVPL